MITLIAIFIDGKYKVDLMGTYILTFIIDLKLFDVIQTIIKG